MWWEHLKWSWNSLNSDTLPYLSTHVYPISYLCNMKSSKRIYFCFSSTVSATHKLCHLLLGCSNQQSNVLLLDISTSCGLLTVEWRGVLYLLHDRSWGKEKSEQESRVFLIENERSANMVWFLDNKSRKISGKDRTVKWNLKFCA